MALTQKLEIPLTILEKGTVIEINFPFEEKEGYKKRPAVIIEKNDKIAVVLALKVTSVKKDYCYAVEISDLKSAGLSKSSWVLTDKELSINIKENNVKVLGHLSENDNEHVFTTYEIATLNNAKTCLSFKGGM